jgi:hypothetical protein
MPKPLVLALCAMSLAACGYPASNSVGVFVGTFPPGASCAVVDGARVVGQVDPTPGIVLVPNQESDYLVSCKRNGFEDANAIVHARAEIRSFRERLGANEIRASGGAITLALVPKRRAVGPIEQRTAEPRPGEAPQPAPIASTGAVHEQNELW